MSFCRRSLEGGIAAGLVMFVVGAIFYEVVPWIAPGIPPQFQNAGLFRPWGGWTSWYMFLHPFGFGFVFTTVFVGLRQGTRFPPGPRGGLIYGIGCFLVGSLPVYLLIFAAFPVTVELTASWMMQSIAQYSLAGMAVGCVVDGASVRASVLLPASADGVWALLLRTDTFLFITEGMMAFPNLEARGPILFREGETIRTGFRVLGVGPIVPHQVQVNRVDAAERSIETSEHGGMVRSWEHRLRVEPRTDTSCLYTDCVSLQAGLLTPLIWLFATIFYRYRQHNWKTWVQQQP